MTSTTLNSRFSKSLSLVASNDGIYVYKRQKNQHPVYFLMSGSQIIGMGKRKSIMERFYSLRPYKGEANYHA